MSQRSRLLALLSLALSASCSSNGERSMEAPEIKSTNLLAGVTVFRGDCPTTNDPSAIDIGDVNLNGTQDPGELYESTLNDFRNNIVPAVMSRGRSAVNSESYKQCLKQVMVTGSVFMPHQPETPMDLRDSWGPYCPPGNFPGLPNCGTMVTRDAHWSRLAADGMAAHAMRSFYARRAWIESHSPNPVIVTATCDPNATTSFHGPVWGENRTADETWFITEEGIQRIVGIINNSNIPTIDKEREFAGMAAIFWHEVMHVHGYDHDRISFPHKQDQIPDIVGACLHDALVRGVTLSGCPATCPNGGRRVPAEFQSSTCDCSADPAVPPSMPLGFTRSWLFTSGAPKVALDSFGEWALRLSPAGAVHLLVGSTWLLQSNGNNDVLAGGSVLVRRTNAGQVMRLLPNSNGTWTDLGTADPNSLALDDLGTIYRRSATQIHMYRVGGTFWEPIGGTSGTIFAGGDHFFATDAANGNIWRYRHSTNTWAQAGGPGAWFTVDAFGTLYGLAPDKSSISRNLGSSTWQTSFGGSAENIDASARFYARESGGSDIWRKYPDGSWHEVGFCPNFVAGGTSVFCVNPAGSNWTISTFERD
jgi:hypothetical protein